MYGVMLDLSVYYSYPLALCSDCVPACRCATVRLTTDQYSPVPPAHLLQVSHFPGTHHVPVFHSSLSLRSIALSIFFPENLRFRGAICPSLGGMTLGLVISFATKMACFPTRNERNLFSPHFSLLSRRQRILPTEPPTPVRSKPFDVPLLGIQRTGPDTSDVPSRLTVSLRRLRRGTLLAVCLSSCSALSIFFPWEFALLSAELRWD